ncbi:hypothetical protein [Streptomyces sp. NWU339]|uniref:hypothetical protein n=1 Tax=Streptomyces sp. NWU339 TaxID=2185284 RepID=UPI00215A3B16|nr:hypothetical protein [Streptomyces sp. NWU339]
MNEVNDMNDMSKDTSRSSGLPQPLRAVASGLRHVPGAEQVGKAAGGALDAIGAVSPRGRRMAVYAGAGVLGVAGVVEWPVALTGAAVAWLTQQRPARPPETESPNGAAPPGEHGMHRPETGTEPEPAPGPPTDQGPGDRLGPSRHRHEPAEPHVHEQPAKVGDTATASALKQVAEATAHHEPHTGRHPGRDGAHDPQTG